MFLIGGNYLRYQNISPKEYNSMVCKVTTREIILLQGWQTIWGARHQKPEPSPRRAWLPAEAAANKGGGFYVGGNGTLTMAAQCHRERERGRQTECRFCQTPQQPCFGTIVH